MLRRELNKDLQDRAQGKYASPVGIAACYSTLGDEERALEWLQRGYEEHSSGMQYLAVDMEFNSFRSNPKYLYWLDVLGLPYAVRTQDLRN